MSCLAAPGDQPEWSPHGETTHEGVDINNTHLSMINSDYSMMPTIFLFIYPYTAHLKQIKAWIESNRSPCWHAITWSWWQVPLLPPTPGRRRESARAICCGRQSVLIELHQSGVIAWRQCTWVDHVVCLKVEFLSHTVLSNENGEFYTSMIYLYLNRLVCLLMGSPNWWRFRFYLSGSSFVFW